MRAFSRAILCFFVLGTTTCQRAAPTEIRLRITAQAGVVVESLRYELRSVVRTSAFQSEITLRVPAAWSDGPTTVRVLGERGATRVASGSVEVRVLAERTVTADVELMQFRCGEWCELGALRCDAGSVVRCVENRATGCVEYGMPEPCSEGRVCSNGACADRCTDECTQNEKRCFGPGGFATCGSHDADACTDWGSAVACPSGTMCSAGQCRTVCASECEMGSVACMSGGRTVCGDRNADGCYEWGPVEPCPTANTCTGGVCNPIPCVDDCAVGERRCSGPTSVSTCGNFDADSCREWGTTATCTAPEVCSDGVCALGCTSVCEGTAATCMAGGVVRCGDRNGDGCREWGPVEACAPASNGTGSCVTDRCVVTCAPTFEPCERSGCCPIAPRLSELQVTCCSSGLVPAFDPSVRDYTFSTVLSPETLNVRAIADPAIPARVRLNGALLGTTFTTTPVTHGVRVEILLERIDLPTVTALYTITVTSVPIGRGLAQRRFVKPDVVTAGDGFGSALDFWSTTLVVGSPNDDASSEASPRDRALPDSGAIYLFDAVQTDARRQLAFFKAFPPGESDRFGSSLAIGGSHIVVGAPLEDSSLSGIGAGTNEAAADAGRAYVFFLETPPYGWRPQTTLKASQVTAGDLFGTSVDISSDGTRAVVGAPGEDSGGGGVMPRISSFAADSGAVYIFSNGGGTTWSQETWIKAPNPTAQDAFGTAVTISGDGLTVAVGAPGEDGAGLGVSSSGGTRTDSGAVYVYRRSLIGPWVLEATLKPIRAIEGGSSFGSSIAISANGSVVAVGAEWAEPSALLSNAGAVYVYRRSVTGVWTAETELLASGGRSGDLFGTGIAMSASGADVIVGARGEDTGNGGQAPSQNSSAGQSGAVFVFRYNGASWSQRTWLKPWTPRANDEFGTAVAIVPGGSLMFVASPRDDSSTPGLDGIGNGPVDALDSGGVYAFEWE